MWMRGETMGEKVGLLNNAGMVSSIHKHKTNGVLIKLPKSFVILCKMRCAVQMYAIVVCFAVSELCQQKVTLKLQMS